MSRFIPMMVIVTLLMSTAVPAQQVRVLTLEETVALALQQNPEIRSAEQEVKKAQAAVWQAYSTILPQINGSAAVQHAWDIQTNTIPNFLKPMLGPLADLIPEISMMPDYVQLSFGLENTFQYGLNLTQPLFLGGAGVASIHMASAGREAAQQQYTAIKQNLIYRSSEAFYQVLLAEELVRVQEKALDQAQVNLDVVSKKYDVGIASGFDKMRAEVEVANLKPRVITSRNNYQSALTQLRTLLALPKETPVQVNGRLDFTPDSLLNASLPELHEKALQHRPEYAALLQQKRISQGSIALARSNYMPKIVFVTDYSFLAMRNDFDLRQDDFSKGFTSAISLQMPLFSGFKNTKTYQTAKLNHQIMLNTEQQLRDGIHAQVEVAYNKLKETAQNYQSTSESVALAEEALRLANLMYEEGVSTQLDVLNANLALTQARLNHISSLFEYQMARYQLRKMIGDLSGIL
ncbi:MAG TPA: TolC family protein [bacterium]|nr:TolC family protein [bacterium]HPG44533.1 TolC family protein [bacterium]HPM97091.1 TolC family protein [bacterium]